jgi:hypothetical protein
VVPDASVASWSATCAVRLERSRLPVATSERVMWIDSAIGRTSSTSRRKDCCCRWNLAGASMQAADDLGRRAIAKREGRERSGW